MMSCLKQAVNLLSPLWSCKAISLNKEWAIAHINSSNIFETVCPKQIDEGGLFS